MAYVVIIENHDSVHVQMVFSGGVSTFYYGNVSKLINRYNHRCPEKNYAARFPCIRMGVRKTVLQVKKELINMIPKHHFIIIEEQNQMALVNYFSMPPTNGKPDYTLKMKLRTMRMQCLDVPVLTSRPKRYCAFDRRVRRVMGICFPRSQPEAVLL